MFKYSNSDKYLYIFVHIKPSSWLQSKWMTSLINVKVHVGVWSLSCTLFLNVRCVLFCVLGFVLTAHPVGPNLICLFVLTAVWTPQITWNPIFSNRIGATFICGLFFFKICNLSLKRHVSVINCALCRNDKQKQILWLKVALVILKFWIKSVLLKPFMSYLRLLCAEVTDVAHDRAVIAIHNILFILLLPIVSPTVSTAKHLEKMKLHLL